LCLAVSKVLRVPAILVALATLNDYRYLISVRVVPYRYPIYALN